MSLCPTLDLSADEFYTHIKTTLTDGIELTKDEFEVYLIKEPYKHILETALMFTSEIFCDELMDKHG
ncbi:hypothetical protein [Marinicella litoralis]|uniref:Uncharacterized protein n=1 Tax=Marinicella litoralis TaxID=644220 RepID=A0A4R6XFT8_9GAMM|nr:hypothetical protein [Marinicella litoralis]TDR14628.1 hypothetical protein C8D91_2955 [Marinicella litoralis]